MIVSVDDLRRLKLGGAQMTPGQQQSATGVLAARQQDLELYCNRPLEPIVIRQYSFSQSDGVVPLWVTPVHQVLSMETVTAELVNAQMPWYLPPVLSRPTELPTDTRVVDRIGSPYTAWRIVPGGIYTNIANYPFLITYVGGYRGYVDDAVKDAILTVAAREYRRMFDHGIGAQGGSPSATTQGDDRPNGWTHDELVRFDRLRRRNVR